MLTPHRLKTLLFAGFTLFLLRCRPPRRIQISPTIRSLRAVSSIRGTQ